MNPVSSDRGRGEAFATLLARWVEGQLGMARIESWLDLAAGLEARCNGTVAPVVAGQLTSGAGSCTPSGEVA